MTRNVISLLLGTALATLSTYGAAEPVDNNAASHSDAPVIVTGSASTDRQIRGEVIRRLDEKPALRFENIDVQSFNHDVYLYGAVGSRMEGEEAEAIARSVPGVREVYNGLGSFGA
jgi:osmotically-inducible protein OsmY